MILAARFRASPLVEHQGGGAASSSSKLVERNEMGSLRRWLVGKGFGKSKLRLYHHYHHHHCVRRNRCGSTVVELSECKPTVHHHDVPNSDEEEHVMVINRVDTTARAANKVEDDDDDLSSVSMISDDLATMRRVLDVHYYQPQGQLQEPKRRDDYDDVPLDVFVPSYLLAYARQGATVVLDEDQHVPRLPPLLPLAAAADPTPTMSVIRSDGPLNLSRLEGIVSVPPSELEPELRARLEATQQLSSMVGPNHPDVLFSLKYVSKLLSRLGDFEGAQVIQEYIQQAHCQLMVDSSRAHY